METKRLKIIFSIVALLLLVPLIAMQFTTEVIWDITDFIIFGSLLLIMAFSIDLALRKLKHSKFKGFMIMAIIILFLLIWAELGVGIFGTPFAGS